MDIPVYRPFLDEREKDTLSQVMDSGWLSSKGEQTEKFEDRVKNLLEVENGLATDSGTAALHAALESLEIEGGEVIVPGLTFGATALAVRQVGAEPVPVDIEEETFGIDPEKLEDALNEDTEAIIVVHLFGQPARIHEIKNICDEHSVPLVEDAAQAFGVTYGDEILGTIGDIGAFSFSWNKTVTTGKGGFITGKDEHMEKVEKIVCNGHGDQRFETEGYNYRMDSIRAAVGNSQMEKLEEIDRKKKELYEAYERELSELEGVETPSETEGIAPWIYYILTENTSEVAEKLDKQGIDTREFYRPLNRLGIVESDEILPVSEKISENGLMLPSSPGTADQADEVAKKIREVIEK